MSVSARIKIIEDFAEENNIELNGSVDGWSQEQMMNFIEEHKIPSVLPAENIILLKSVSLT